MTTQGHRELGRPQSLELCSLGFKNDLCESKSKQKLVGVSLALTREQLLNRGDPSALPPFGAALPQRARPPPGAPVASSSLLRANPLTTGALS